MAGKPGKYPGRQQSDRERADLFIRRRNRSEKLDWSRVDADMLRAALLCCGESSVTLSFAPAHQGIGVVVRIYAGNQFDDAYAGSAAELDELLELLIEEYGSKSEDPVQAIKGLRVVKATGD